MLSYPLLRYVFLWVVCNSYKGLIDSFLFPCAVTDSQQTDFHEILYWLFLQKILFCSNRDVGLNINTYVLRAVRMLVLCVIRI